MFRQRWKLNVRLILLHIWFNPTWLVIHNLLGSLSAMYLIFIKVNNADTRVDETSRSVKQPSMHSHQKCAVGLQKIHQLVRQDRSINQLILKGENECQQSFSNRPQHFDAAWDQDNAPFKHNIVHRFDCIFCAQACSQWVEAHVADGQSIWRRRHYFNKFGVKDLDAKFVKSSGRHWNRTGQEIDIDFERIVQEMWRLCAQFVHDAQKSPEKRHFGNDANTNRDQHLRLFYTSHNSPLHTRCSWRKLIIYFPLFLR